MTPIFDRSPLPSVRKDPNGWVFSPIDDFACFILPIAFAAVITIFKIFAYEGTLIAYVWFVLFLDQGHVFATYLPILRAKNNLRLFIVPLFILCTVIALLCFVQSARTFAMLAAYASIFHSTRQHFGWLRITQRKADVQPRFALFEQVVFWTVILYPILYWHSESSQLSGAYFSPNDLFLLSISTKAEQICRWAFWILVAAYAVLTVYRGLVEKKWERGRLLFMFATWTYFYVGICIIQQREFFLIALLASHGLSYHTFIYKNFMAPSPNKSENKTRFLQPLIYFAAIVFLGFGAKFATKYFPGIADPEQMTWTMKLAQSMFLSLSLSHYVWDSFIWRQQARILVEGFTKDFRWARLVRR